MKEQLLKAMRRHQMMNMIYLSNQGVISKRCVKIIKVDSHSFQAYCYTRRAKRTFIIDNVLAICPIVEKEREII
ncbi:transcriptional regulator [Lysinibacillus sp. NPDC096418]|uniref:transcriptional regulator n=1 Tax=Lysinibacillus sp. NPDC096418 TaxID=3364138 RepID=UPI003817B87B